MLNDMLHCKFPNFLYYIPNEVLFELLIFNSKIIVIIYKLLIQE